MFAGRIHAATLIVDVASGHTFTDANLTGARLMGLDLTGAIGLVPAQIASAKLEDTRVPESLSTAPATS